MIEKLTPAGLQQAIDNIAFIVAKEAILFSASTKSPAEKQQVLDNMDIIYDKTLNDVMELCVAIELSSDLSIEEIIELIMKKTQQYLDDSLLQ